jgi:hypothetical protein
MWHGIFLPSTGIALQDASAITRLDIQKSLRIRSGVGSGEDRISDAHEKIKAREIRKSAALLVRHTLAYPQRDGPVNVYLYCSDARSAGIEVGISSLDFQH